jgi:hypothetical protein
MKGDAQRYRYVAWTMIIPGQVAGLQPDRQKSDEGNPKVDVNLNFRKSSLQQEKKISAESRRQILCSTKNEGLGYRAA